MYLNRWKQILKIAWPLIIANSFWNLQLTIDRMFLGQFSTEALGAAMAVMGVFWVPMALLQGTCSYVTTFVAQYTGANEKEKISEVTWHAFVIAIFGGLIFLLQNLCSQWFFQLINHPTSVQKLEVEYFNSVAYSALPTALVAVVSGFYTGLGQTQKIITINFVGLILNALLDYLLIFGNWGFPQMGVAGAGYATAIATYGAAIIGIYMLIVDQKNQQFNFKLWIKFNYPLFLNYIKYGLPSGLQWALEGLAFTVFLIIMGRLHNGEVALASSSIAVTVMMLSVLPSMGVAQAVMSLVGQNLGENKPDNAEHATWSGIQVSLIYMTCVATSFIFIPEFYLSWFANQENAHLWLEVSHVVPQLLKLVAVFTILDSLYLNISFALKGAGDTKFVSLIALITPWPIMVLPTYLIKEWSNAVVWSWGFAALYSLTIVVLLLIRFKKGLWKKMRVI